MHLPPPPDSRELLPPLLACLPTTFVSRQPPPALLPLLSPVLRQRLNFLSAGHTNTSDGWVPLLSWDSERAAKLPAIVERLHLEPHPVSGELEVEDVQAAQYRSLDEETLQARLEVEQFDLLPIYIWCESDEHGGTGPGWKLAELRSLEDLDDSDKWYSSPAEANNAAFLAGGRSLTVSQANGTSSAKPIAATEEANGEDEDYWASYDHSPGRTPAPTRSPAPASQSTFQHSNRQRSQSELDYYARYGVEVQPALDTHDPDEETPEMKESTLRGDSLLERPGPASRSNGMSLYPTERAQPRPNDASLYPATSSNLEQSTHSDLEAPRAISPSASPSSIERLEAEAAAIGSERIPDRAQLAVQQHISTDIKSLFRLAKSSGMAREEFERIVKTELDCLGFLDNDE